MKPNRLAKIYSSDHARSVELLDVVFGQAQRGSGIVYRSEGNPVRHIGRKGRPLAEFSWLAHSLKNK